MSNYIQNPIIIASTFVPGLNAYFPCSLPLSPPILYPSVCDGETYEKASWSMSLCCSAGSPSKLE